MGTDALARQVTVAIVEDHEVVIDGVRSWIDRDPTRRVRVVATGDSIEDVLAAATEQVDVILLDLELHKVMVIDQAARLSDAGYRVVIFSAHTGPTVVTAALDAGACAYLSKDETREHCVETIVSVATDRPYVTRSLAGAMLADPQLSGREREALLLWFQGMDMGSVAHRMDITEHTVKQYIDRARVKYARVGRPVPSRFALLARAIEDGLIRPEEVGDYHSSAS
ncbi:MAG: two-component system, NarL family, nitrate/nitrite response regulator NarL [Micromonosporaceae bacterium]|jgi:DNA-binding NarL/FixJ family response regulator